MSIVDFVFLLFVSDQSQTFRRGAGRQTSDGWRRSRGDDDDNANGEQSEDPSTPANGSSSWTSSRNGLARRVNSNGSMDQRTKSNDKWSHNDERSGSSGSGGWRTNSSTSDRDFNSRRLPTKRERTSNTICLFFPTFVLL